MTTLTIVPMAFADARAYVAEHHRHHPSIVGHKFSVGVVDQHGDGCPNACSALYGAAWRATRALGYRKLITYTLQTEPGTSLRAAGWRIVGEVTGRKNGWNCGARPKADDAPTAPKFRWEPAA